VKNFISILLLVSNFVSVAQLNWNKTIHNFGSIEKDSKRWVDFEMTNNTNTHLYLMRASKDSDVNLIYTRGKIEKDSLAYVRVQINPETVGPFNKKIELFVSSEQDPIELKIKGSINYIDPNSDPACPDFSSHKPKTNSTLIAVIEVLDSETKKPIKNATLNVSNPQQIIHNAISDRDGKSSFNTISGFHNVFASAEGYQSSEKSQPITYNNNFITIYLDNELIPEPEISEEKNIDKEINNYIKEAIAESHEKENREEQPIEQVKEYINIIEEEVEFIADDYIPQSVNELSANEYAPNNIIFLMDISNSMNKLEKLDLLKIAVKEMVGVMRSFDRIAIITYASSVKVILPSTSGAEKSTIISTIDSLKAAGLTAGSSGIKQAYETAFHNYIEGANNQIVITTDGAFNVGIEDYNTKQEVLVNSFKGVKLSVVGVKTGKLYITDLENLAKWGRGHYIHIKNESQAKASLVQELKTNSKK
jgi:Mg-chelatase subunit ChlD